MKAKKQKIGINVVNNNPTVLPRIIQIVKRRYININKLIDVPYERWFIQFIVPPVQNISVMCLLMEDKFYRVNDKGQRWLLLDESKKRIE